MPTKQKFSNGILLRVMLGIRTSLGNRLRPNRTNPNPRRNLAKQGSALWTISDSSDFRMSKERNDPKSQHTCEKQHFFKKDRRASQNGCKTLEVHWSFHTHWFRDEAIVKKRELVSPTWSTSWKMTELLCGQWWRKKKSNLIINKDLERRHLEHPEVWSFT